MITELKYIDAKIALKITALFGAAGVGLGAFGAHGLEDFLIRHDRVDTWETATFYLLIHTVVMLFLTLRREWRPGTWLCFALGVAVFADSLYWLSLTQWGWLGAITPVGGVLMIAGWLMLVFRS